MDKLINEFMKNRGFVLIGASANKEKYGNVILKMLSDADYKVIPINPKKDKIEGIDCYNNLESVPQDTPYINMVVPPKIGLKMVDSMKKKGCKIAWLQIGAESDELVESLKKAEIEVIYGGPCILVALRTVDYK